MSEEEKAGEEPVLPPPFEALCLGLYGQAVVSLGLMAHPTTGKQEKDLVGARRAIDYLTAIEAKTKGNLTAHESEFLTGILDELRRAFVRLS
jgi:hypothetical protein